MTTIRFYVDESGNGTSAGVQVVCSLATVECAWDTVKVVALSLLAKSIEVVIEAVSSGGSPRKLEIIPPSCQIFPSENVTP